MRFTIDRFEGNFAVCEGEGRKMSNILRSVLPAGAKEGTAIIFDGKEYTIDADTTTSERIKRKMDSLWGK